MNFCEGSWVAQPLLIEPPASFVFLSTVPFVVVIVLVVGAEFHALVTSPFGLRNLIASRQSISSSADIDSKGKAEVILLAEKQNNDLHEVKDVLLKGLTTLNTLQLRKLSGHSHSVLF